MSISVCLKIYVGVIVDYYLFLLIGLVNLVAYHSVAKKILYMSQYLHVNEEINLSVLTNLKVT